MAYTETDLKAVQDYFGFLRAGPVEKDFHVVRAISALASLEAAPFALVFAGGTALARAHKLVRRMSEDVDFKIVPGAATALSRSSLRQRLGVLRDQVTGALQAAGFAFDPADPLRTRSRNESRYTVWQLPYDSNGGAAEGLRPSIQMELTYSPLRLPPVALPVRSFVAEAFSRPAEVASIECVSVTETAAEKLVALTRRTAMEIVGLSREADPALVRHIYDLHILQRHIDAGQVAVLARAIAGDDAEEFRNQYPAYADDTAAETRRALAALSTDPLYRRRYEDFVSAMVYGERPGFDEAFETVRVLAQRWLAD